jgi:hypothetical protein
MISFDDPSMWIQTCEQHVVLFRHVMPMVVENLAITQHQNTFQYATIRGGGYKPQVYRFEPKDYVYLQQTTPTTLDVTTSCVVLCSKGFTF